jgi:hypothetical protein
MVSSKGKRNSRGVALITQLGRVGTQNLREKRVR